MTPSLSPVGAFPETDCVRDVSLQTFVADVIEASKAQLVIVDFWATWCGPCKQLTPVLEKLVRSYKGAVRLAKIDIDRNPHIAQQMGVQSVPAVFAFIQGRPVDGFMGGVPESQVKAWLEGLVKSVGGVHAQGNGLATALKQAEEYVAAKDFVTAQAIYADILDMEPANAPSYIGLMRCCVELGDLAKARQMFDQAPENVVKDKLLASVRSALELAEQAAAGAGAFAALTAQVQKNPADHQARFDLALACFGLGQREEAVEHLLEIVRSGKKWNDDAARKQLVKFFEAFGVMDPLTIAARKKLSSLLFS